jgi:hypothetical protein
LFRARRALVDTDDGIARRRGRGGTVSTPDGRGFGRVLRNGCVDTPGGRPRGRRRLVTRPRGDDSCHPRQTSSRSHIAAERTRASDLGHSGEPLAIIPSLLLQPQPPRWVSRCDRASRCRCARYRGPLPPSQTTSARRSTQSSPTGLRGRDPLPGCRGRPRQSAGSPRARGDRGADGDADQPQADAHPNLGTSPDTLTPARRGATTAPAATYARRNGDRHRPPTPSPPPADAEHA